MNTDRLSEEQVVELTKAYEFVESMLGRADIKTPDPLWHGWALREAFMAGYKYVKEADKASQP